MRDNDCSPVEVSRRIAASAAEIFCVLTSRSGQVDIDGPGMLQGA